jgi:hypothetical protein
LVRASTTIAPSLTAASTARGASGAGESSRSRRGPRLIATICSTLGGFSPMDATDRSTNSASSVTASSGLLSRS